MEIPPIQAEKWICQLFINFQILSKFSFPRIYSVEELQSCAIECQLFIKPNFASSLPSKNSPVNILLLFCLPPQMPGLIYNYSCH